MNHKWEKAQTDYYTKHRCIRCGCTKTTINRHPPQYARSGQFFGFTHRPDCIDMEVENKKTID